MRDIDAVDMRCEHNVEKGALISCTPSLRLPIAIIFFSTTAFLAITLPRTKAPAFVKLTRVYNNSSTPQKDVVQ
jgi:hypothetical protein